jgi:hypothetical protein
VTHRPIHFCGLQASSAWNHPQGEIGDYVNASRPSRKEIDR